MLGRLIVTDYDDEIDDKIKNQKRRKHRNYDNINNIIGDDDHDDIDELRQNFPISDNDVTGSYNHVIDMKKYYMGSPAGYDYEQIHGIRFSGMRHLPNRARGSLQDLLWVQTIQILWHFL